MPITFEYFFFSLTFTFIIILLLSVFLSYHRGEIYVWKKKVDYNNEKIEDFSLTDTIKKYISSNWILLVLFIILICILNLVNTSIFAGVDPWLHISVVRYITEVNYIPMNIYYGSLGLHTFGAVIQFFSGVDLILLPKYFIFYTIPVSALILYNIFMKIFKNKNLAIFGVFLLFSSFSFSWFMMVQFWPSSIALIQGLVIF
ncbi:MAG: hypothetical protein ACFFG0_47060, partial [Candidatus Thorarchaeota archaeon]